MHAVDQARRVLELDRLGRHWAFDWSTVRDGVVHELLAEQHERTFTTSGSTGDPKAITRSADGLVRELDVTMATLDGKHDSVHATVHPSSLYGYVGACVGAGLGVPTTFDQWGAHRVPIVGSNPLVFVVPAAWRSVRTTLDEGTWTCATIVHAGSTLPPAVVAYASDPARRRSVEVLDLFGTTETGLIGVRRVHPQQEGAWTTCADTVLDFPVVDDDGEGRPVVTSPRVVDPAQPDASAVQLDDWLVPCSGRRFGFRGRRLRLVKPGGRRVDLDLLEAQISALFSELDIACQPRVHTELGEDVEVFVVGRAGTGVELEVLSRLRRAPVRSLTFVPRWVTAVDHIPRSAMGKPRRVLNHPNKETAA